MDADSKVWLVILFLSLLVISSYYGIFRLGRYSIGKEIRPMFVKEVTAAYGDGYNDGLKQGQLDCVVKGVINGTRK